MILLYVEIDKRSLNSILNKYLNLSTIIDNLTLLNKIGIYLFNKKWQQ